MNSAVSFRLASLPAALVGVARGMDADHVVVTAQGHGVFTYRLDDQTCVHSWLVRSGTSFSHHAVAHAATKTYFAVQDGHSMLAWNDAQENLERVERKPLPTRVLSLFAPNELAHHLLLVGEDATVSTWTVPELRAASSVKLSSAPLASDAVALPSGDMALFVALASGDVAVVSVGASDGSLALLATLPTGSPLGAPVSVCVDITDHRLFLLGGECELRAFSLSADLHKATAEYTQHLRFGHSARPEKGAGTRSISMAVPAPGWLVVAGWHDSSGAPVLTLWETRYRTVQRSSTLAVADADPQPPSESGKRRAVRAATSSAAAAAAAGVRQVLVVGGAVLSVVERSVLCTAAHCAEPTAAAALSTAPQTAAFLQPADASALLQPAAVAEVDLSSLLTALSAGEEFAAAGSGPVRAADVPDALWQRVESAEKEEAAVLAALLDPTRTPSEAAFCAVFDPFVAARRTEPTPRPPPTHVDPIEDVAAMALDPQSTFPKPERKLKRWEKEKRRREKIAKRAQAPKREFARCNLSAPFLQSTAARCVRDRFWTPLRTLIRTHELSSRAVPSLLPTLMEQGQLVRPPRVPERSLWLATLLDECMVCVHDISEADIVALLRYYLSTVGEDAAAAFVRSREAELPPLEVPAETNPFRDSPRDILLAALLTVPKTQSLLYQWIRTLAVEEVLYLFHLLLRWLRRLTKHTPREVRKLFRFRFPNAHQVLDWLCIVLDAHFMTLALTPAATGPLKQAAEVVRRELALCNRLHPLSGFLAHMLQRKPLPKPTVSEEYVVETMDL